MTMMVMMMMMLLILLLSKGQAGETWKHLKMLEGIG